MKQMKNKQVVKDERGYRWYVHKNGKAEPVDWKDQALFLEREANKNEKKK